MDAIVLGDRRRLELGERTVGGSKNETRFGQLGPVRVVVKIEGTHGHLAAEEQALRFLARHGVGVPRVLASGVTADDRPFLVISREPGVTPVTPAGWARFGRDLAALLDVPVAGCPLRPVTVDGFVADHRERLGLVRPLLSGELAAEIARAIDEISGETPLVVTHGDPGSGNYLDDPAGAGTLLDWETTLIAPLGLDLGRAAFIGLMDLKQTGIPDELVAALIRGYTGRSAFAGRIAGPRLRAWVAVAGLQFIHGRHTQPLRPDRTPQIAAGVLRAYLESRPNDGDPHARDRVGAELVPDVGLVDDERPEGNLSTHGPH